MAEELSHETGPARQAETDMPPATKPPPDTPCSDTPPVRPSISPISDNAKFAGSFTSTKSQRNGGSENIHNTGGSKANSKKITHKPKDINTSSVRVKKQATEDESITSMHKPDCDRKSSTRKRKQTPEQISVETSGEDNSTSSATESTPQRKKVARSAPKRKGIATPIKRSRARESSSPPKPISTSKAFGSQKSTGKVSKANQTKSFPWDDDEESDTDGMPTTKGKKYHCG